MFSFYSPESFINKPISQNFYKQVSYRFILEKFEFMLSWDTIEKVSYFNSRGTPTVYPYKKLSKEKKINI